MQMTTLLSFFCDYDCLCTKPLLGVIEIVVCMYYARIHSAFLYGTPFRILEDCRLHAMVVLLACIMPYHPSAVLVRVRFSFASPSQHEQHHMTLMPQW